MKKLLKSALALATVFFAASCTQEKLQPVGSNTVSFKVEIPEVATKAAAVGNDASMINDLVYAVYKTTAASVDEALDDWAGTTTFLYAENSVDPRFSDNSTDVVNVELLNDQNHIVLLWAQHADVWVSQHGDAIDLTNITYPSNLEVSASCADKYAAFSGVKFIVANDKTNTEAIELTRPFAQINIATVKPENYAVVINSTDVTVNAAGDKFNVAAQRPTDSKDVTYSWAGKVYEVKLNANSQNYDHYLAMGYVFAAGNVSVDYTIVTAKHGTITNTITNVPVAKNYRTNIIGNLLTSDVDYNVVLDKNWGDAGKNMEVIIDGLVKNINGDYEISTDDALIYAINNLWVDEHGAANPATFYVYPREYNITDDQIRDIHLTSGTLKVIKDIPVMTRSTVFDGIVIKGLSKPLIATVGEEATVVISGVTIQNYEGDGQQGALIGENDGKVIIEDCVIVDETGAADETTELVGDADDNGVVAEPEFEVAGNSAIVYDAAQLAAAFAATEVDNIVLGANIAVEETLVFPEGRTATLDLKGFELKTAENMASVAALVAVNGDLTVNDSYGIGGIRASNISAIFANHGGKLTINCNVSAHESAVRAEGGEIVISGGKYVQTGTYYSDPSTLRYTIDCRADAEGNVGKLTINGGEFVSNNGLINAGGEVTINGGKFNNDISEVAATRHMMYVNGSAIVNINGGEFYGKANAGAGGEHICVYTSKATVNIAAGKFTSLKGNGSANAIISEYSAGSAISVTGGMFNTNLGLTKYIHKDYKAVKNDETALWDVVKKVYVVKVTEEEKYESIQDAVDAAKANATITFLTDIEQVDGVLITDKNLTIDLNGKTFTVSEGASTNNRNFKINGSSVVTIKNGTMVARGTISSGAYGTVRTEGSANVTLENVKAYSYRGYGLNIKANTGTTITINDSEIYAQYSGGVEAVGGEIVLNDVKIVQNGIDSQHAWCSVAIGVNGGGKVTVNSGEYSATAIATDSNAAQGTWVAYVMSSGGTLDINGGTFNGTVAETAIPANACGLICADRAAVVNIKGGTFNSNGAILDMRNNVGTQPNPVATLSGGTFSADPRVSGLYSSNLISVAEGYEVYQEGDLWKVGEEGIRSWDEFTNALAAGETEFKLQADLITDSNYTLSKDITLDLNGKTLEISPAGGTLNIGDAKNSTKPNVTIKNGNLNCMVYGLSGNVTITDVVFGGTVTYVQASQGVISTKHANLLMDNCKMTNVTKSGSTKPRSICTEGRSTGSLILRNCNFKNTNLDRPYINPLNGSATLELTKCQLYSGATNIDIGASCVWSNLNLTECSGGFTFTISRASTSLTEDELSVYRAIKTNNSGSMRFIFSDGEKNNL